MFSVESNHSSKRFFVFKKITVIIVLPIVVWLFFGLTGWPFHLDVIFLFMPVAVSLLILWKAGKSDAAKCISLLTLKPVLNLLLNYLPGIFVSNNELNNIYPYNVVRSVSWVIPELLLTCIIVYAFRHLLHREKFIVVFLIVDVIRWLSVFISLWFPDPIPEPYFYWQLYIAVFFIFLFPFMYALAGFIVIKERTNTHNTAY
jgi:hypothetical protein